MAWVVGRQAITWTILELLNKHQWNFNNNTKLFIHENLSENVVYEIAAIFFQGEMS